MPLRRIKKRYRLALLLLVPLVTAGVCLQVAARAHVKGMTNFVPGGARPDRPEELSFAAKLRLLLTGIEIARPVNSSTPADLGLEYVTFSLEEESPTLECWRIPANDPKGRVLLLHGYAAAKSSMLREAAVFAKLGYEVVLLDFRGSGGSGGNRTTLGWYEAEDVARVVDTFPDDLPLVIYGQSMGAVAALRAIHLNLVHPDRLILEAPFDELKTTVDARFEAMGVPKWPCSNLLLWNGGRVLSINPKDFTPWIWARSVECPTLHLAGDSDRRVPETSTAKIHEQLAGEKLLVWFEGTGHVALQDAAPNVWRAAVTGFLR